MSASSIVPKTGRPSPVVIPMALNPVALQKVNQGLIAQNYNLIQYIGSLMKRCQDAEAGLSHARVIIANTNLELAAVQARVAQVTRLERRIKELELQIQILQFGGKISSVINQPR